MKLISSIVIAPLFLFSFSGFIGYFLAFETLYYVFCNHPGVSIFNTNIKSSFYEHQMDTSRVNESKTDKVLDKPNQMTIDEIKYNYQHPHQKPKIDLTLACFVKETKGKSTEYSEDSWLKFCDEGKILGSKFFSDFRKSKNPDANASSIYQETFENYLDADNTGIKYDYFLFAEADTYIIVSNLLEYIKNEDSTHAKAYGHAVMSKENIFLKFGGTILLNRKAMEILVYNKKYESQDESNGCFFGSYMPDSEQLLKCLIANGGHAIDSRDHASRSAFFPTINPYIFLKKDFSSTSKYQETTSECQKKDCLSPFPIAIHNLKYSEFKLAHFLISWCRYALFLNDYKDPEIGINGLTFKGDFLSRKKRKEYVEDK